MSAIPKDMNIREEDPRGPAPVIVTLGDFLARVLPPREMLLAPWLPRQGLAMVHAYRGIGKTHFALAVGYAVASGGSFLGWQAPTQAGVPLLDGEMPGPALQERLGAIVAHSDMGPQAPFEIMTPDLQPKDQPAFNLAQPENQVALEPKLRDVSLIIVDNLATLCRTGQTNDADSWLPVQAWALRQRAAGRSVLFIHHSGKSGAQRGTSAKEDVLEPSLGLSVRATTRAQRARDSRSISRRHGDSPGRMLILSKPLCKPTRTATRYGRRNRWKTPFMSASSRCMMKGCHRKTLPRK